MGFGGWFWNGGEGENPVYDGEKKKEIKKKGADDRLGVDKRKK